MNESIATAKSPDGARGFFLTNLSIGLAQRVQLQRGPSYLVFALIFAALGILGLVYGDFAMTWQRIPIEQLPGQVALAYLVAVIELIIGVGLLIPRAATVSSRVLLIFLMLWLVLLKLPAVIAMPAMEATWLGFGEIGVIAAGGWVIFAALHADTASAASRYLTGRNGIRMARVLLAISLPMIGLSHFFYSAETTAFVPTWIPYPLFWVYLTGSGSVAASLGILFGVLPRLAATLEAAMLGVITVLVWLPGFFVHPTDRLQCTGFVISSAIAVGAWVVADSYHQARWLTQARSA